MLGSVQTFDGNLLPFSGTIVFRGRINQLTIEVEDDFSALRLNLPDCLLQFLKPALRGVRRVNRIAGIHAFGRPAEQEKRVNPGFRGFVIRLLQLVVGEKVFSVLMCRIIVAIRLNRQFPPE